MAGACIDDAEGGEAPREYHIQPTTATITTKTMMIAAATPGLMFCFTSGPFPV